MQNHYDHALNSKQAARYIASMDFPYSETDITSHLVVSNDLECVYHQGERYYTTIDLEAWACSKYQMHDNVVIFPVTNCRIDWFTKVESVELALAA